MGRVREVYGLVMRLTGAEPGAHHGTGRPQGSLQNVWVCRPNGGAPLNITATGSLAPVSQGRVVLDAQVQGERNRPTSTPLLNSWMTEWDHLYATK